MRLQKYMAKCGVASRRKSERMIEDGLVKVNGETIKKQGVKIDPKLDRVEVKGEMIRLEENKVYIKINKPIGYVTTMDDEKNRKIVVDLISGIEERIYPVGRLDMDTSGLLILTNDGKVTNKITHPRNQVPKTYVALVDGIPNKEKLELFKRGIILDGKKTSNADIEIIEKYKTNSLVKMTIIEGRNRQIRRMCESIGHRVISLERIAIGEIGLDDLNLGEWKHLNKKEKKYILSL